MGGWIIGAINRKAGMESRGSNESCDSVILTVPFDARPNNRGKNTSEAPDYYYYYFEAEKNRRETDRASNGYQES